MTIAARPIEEIYEQKIKVLAREEQIYLLKLITDGLAATITKEDEKKHSLLAFEGAGAHNPIGMDAQEYVTKLREEWAHRP